MKFTYVGLGPNDSDTTIRAMGRNPKVRRCWNPVTGKLDPRRALKVVEGVGRIAAAMRFRKFDVKTLKITSLKRRPSDDLEAVIVDGKGTRIELSLDDVLKTPFGLKMFDVPSAKIRPAGR